MYQAPGRLKGLFDRLLTPGFAFQSIDGKALLKALLAGRKAGVVITSDTPAVFLKWIYGNAWVKVLRRQILKFCGFKDLKVKYFSPVRGAKPEALAKMVEDSIEGLAGFRMARLQSRPSKLGHPYCECQCVLSTSYM
jgi:putative NADPH-quinone reductase